MTNYPYPFSTETVHLPDHDCDVVLLFPNGKEVHIQIRPSNAEHYNGFVYNGSLDVILPDNRAVYLYKDDDLEPAPQINIKDHPHGRISKQIVCEIP
jgi:hypothetical protein